MFLPEMVSQYQVLYQHADKSEGLTKKMLTILTV